jgi:hypothetical protein
VTTATTVTTVHRCLKLVKKICQTHLTFNDIGTVNGGSQQFLYKLIPICDFERVCACLVNSKFSSHALLLKIYYCIKIHSWEYPIENIYKTSKPVDLRASQLLPNDAITDAHFLSVTTRGFEIDSINSFQKVLTLSSVGCRRKKI